MRRHNGGGAGDARPNRCALQFPFFMIGVVLAVAMTAMAQDAPPTETQPADGPWVGDRVVNYKPGVIINFTQRQVQVRSTVIRHEPPIELFACSPRIREHEALIRIEARPREVYEALGLIGLTPGHPVQWDEKTGKTIPATGDPVLVHVRYERDGKQTTVDAWDWLARADGKPLTEHPPWVFAGSLQDNEGRFAADLEGTVVAVVDFPDALLALSQLHTSSNEELWLAPAADKMPPIGAACTLLLSPAIGKNTLELLMDRFGKVTTAAADINAEIETTVRTHFAEQTNPKILLTVSPLTAASDVQRFVRRLKEWGVPESAIEVRQRRDSSMRPNDPEAVRLLLARRMSITSEIRTSLADQQDMARQQFTRARSVVNAVVEASTEAIDTSVGRVQTLLSKDGKTAPRGEPIASSPTPEQTP